MHETRMGRDRAYIWDPGTSSMTELPTVGGTSATSADDGTGFGINEANTIAGHARNADGQLEAFSWNGSNTSGLGQLGGSQTRAWDINESGQIPGWGSDSTGTIVAFRWSSGVGYEFVGELQSGDATFGIGINDDGDIVGSATASSRSRAWLWDGTSIVDLGEAPGFAGAGANHLNNLDQVVGLSYQFDGDGNRIENTATLWDGGQAFNLNDHLVDGGDWYLQNAYNINDAGQIVGWGTLSGATRGFVLTPIPEPSTLVLLSGALVGTLAVGSPEAGISRVLVSCHCRRGDARSAYVIFSQRPVGAGLSRDRSGESRWHHRRE